MQFVSCKMGIPGFAATGFRCYMLTIQSWDGRQGCGIIVFEQRARHEAGLVGIELVELGSM